MSAPAASAPAMAAPAWVPSQGDVRGYHIIVTSYGWPVAACFKAKRLDPTAARPADSVGEQERCSAEGCRERWPEPSLQAEGPVPAASSTAREALARSLAAALVANSLNHWEDANGHVLEIGVDDAVGAVIGVLNDCEPEEERRPAQHETGHDIKW